MGVRWSCGGAEGKNQSWGCVQHGKPRTRKHEGKREETTGGRCRPWPSGHGVLRDIDVMLRPSAQKGGAALASQRGSSTDEQRATQGGKGGDAWGQQGAPALERCGGAALGARWRRARGRGDRATVARQQRRKRRKKQRQGGNVVRERMTDNQGRHDNLRRHGRQT